MARFIVGADPQPQFVVLTLADGEVLIDGEFLVPPISVAMRRAWERRFRICQKCSGIGVLSLGGDNAAKCPVCRASVTAPNLDDPKIQQELGVEICLGWRGVPTKEGPEYDFSDEHRDDLIAKIPAVFWGLVRAGEDLSRGLAKTQGKV